MVLKKNIMIKLFLLLNLLCLLVGCNYQYTDVVNLNLESINKIYLNVKSFEINKDSLESIEIDNSLHNEINEKVLKNIEIWAWTKFSIKGKQNIAYLNLLKIDTNLVEKEKTKKSIASFIDQKKEIYNLSLDFDLSMTDNKSLTKILKISSNLDLVLLDKYSIIQRDKVITQNVEKLIKLIDEKVNVQLNKDAFKKFVIK